MGVIIENQRRIERELEERHKQFNELKAGYVIRLGYNQFFLVLKKHNDAQLISAIELTDINRELILTGQIGKCVTILLSFKDLKRFRIIIPFYTVEPFTLPGPY